jgi:hypothetical protein
MKEALKLALEALEFNGNIWHMACKKDEAIIAIKEALAQPEQEPEAFISPGGHIHYNPYLDSVPLYTTPPKRPWVGLTEAEVEDCMEMSIQKTCRAIEAKLKEKNT